ncbi:hypothetical protein MKY24_16890 [Paenibacillus sp. FSL P2-0322]|jgi:phage terminase Nu1 subunit (DNA packaging protein)|uniref:hypothetical protein n=1 Tax=Paenibacillus sp. FSL P2-0322 TaxID=2921628 RepID=UPI0030D10F46
MGKGENRPEGIVGTSELATIVGKTKQWIGQLTRDGVLTQVSRGKYDLAASVQAYIRHVTGTSEEGKVSFAEEKAAHEQIKKEMAMLDLQKMRGNLHTTGDVLDAWGELLVSFRERLRGLPPRIANELAYMTDEKAIRILLENRIDEALTELGKYDPLAEKE